MNQIHSAPKATPTNRCEPQSTAVPKQAATPNERYEQITEYTDETGTRRRIRYVPQADGVWCRIEERWETADWQRVSYRTITELNQWSRPIR